MSSRIQESKEGRHSVLLNRRNSKYILTAVLWIALFSAMQISAFAAGPATGGAKHWNMSVAYGITTLLSLALAGG